MTVPTSASCDIVCITCTGQDRKRIVLQFSSVYIESVFIVIIIIIIMSVLVSLCVFIVSMQ